MNSFFKTFWAALLAFLAANILIIILSIIVFAGMTSSLMPKAKSVEDGTVLKFNLSEIVTDSPNNSLNINLMDISFTTSNSLYQVLSAIEAARYDDNIRGIYICAPQGNSLSIAMCEELREALEEFKTEGKFIIGYNQTYTQSEYYLASVADRLYMNPEGMFDWHGMGVNVMFYKGLLDKLDIKPEIIRHGTFKSAVEPYLTDRMSDANRLQMQTLAGSLWTTVLEGIAASRQVSVDKLQQYADHLEIVSTDAAVERGLIDQALYEDQVMEVLTRLVDGERLDSLTGELEGGVEVPAMVTMSEYIASVANMRTKISKNKVAIVYADGQIVSGESGNGTIGDETVGQKLAEARRDDKVKAVVFRVNSPGGSAFASEVIWRELSLLRQQKPVVVSMGSYAASGGYYISAPADLILADRTTLTGSIGVFSMMFNAGDALKNKLGITVDGVKTATSADMGTPWRALTTPERDFLQLQVEDIYRVFVDHVAQGRNMTFAQVDSIGQGRVWSGINAKEIGLVDGFGGLKNAIVLAAERAGIADDFRVSESVDPMDNVMVMLTSLMGSSARSRAVQSELGQSFKYYEHLRSILCEDEVQARLPYQIEIN